MKRLKTDPIVLLSVVVLGFIGTTKLLSFLGFNPLPGVESTVIELPLYFLAIAALFYIPGKVPHPEQRRFWQFLAAGVVGMVTANTIQIPMPDEASLSSLVLEDSLYILCFVMLFWAVDFRPDRRPGWAVGDSIYRVKVAGTIVSLAAVGIYFVIVPAAQGDPAYRTFIPSFTAFAIIQAVLGLRLIYLGLTSPLPQWRTTYLMLSAAVAAWFARDLLELLEFNGILEYPSAPIVGLLLYIPYVFIIVVALIRNHHLVDASSSVAGQWNDVGNWETPAYLLTLAFGMPIMHMFLRVSTEYGTFGQGLRSSLIMAASVGLASLAVTAIVIDRRRNRPDGRHITVLLSDEEFSQSRKMEALGRLAGGVAHDLNNLLMVMRGYSDLLSTAIGQRPPEAEYVEQLNRAVGRSASLTHQLLAFSRKQILAPRELDLNSIVEEAREMLRRIIREDIEIVTRLGDTGWVKADPAQISQVVFNLAINAGEAMPGGGRLEIGTENVELKTTPGSGVEEPKEGAYVRLYVKDNGRGIDPKTQAHLFEPFFTTKSEFGGTGLGLATVYGIVTQSRGRIVVDSEPGKGATFSVYLPRVEPRPEPATRPEVIGTRRALELQGTILLAEDDPSVRMLARDHLQAQGYRVLEAGDGAAAVRAFESVDKPIDLLLTDIVMPRMGGVELAERIAVLCPDVKVLFMSGHADMGLKDKALENSVVMTKPFSMNELESTVRRMLRAEA